MSQVSFTLWGKRPSCKGRVTRDFVRQGNLCNSIIEGPEMGRGIMTGYCLFCWTENRHWKPLSALQPVKGVLVTVVNPVTNETLQNRNHPFLAVLEEKKGVCQIQCHPTHKSSSMDHFLGIIFMRMIEKDVEGVLFRQEMPASARRPRNV